MTHIFPSRTCSAVSDAGPRTLSRALAANVSLTHLDLRDNKRVTTKGIKAVLGACDKGQLRSLDLSNTRIGGGGLKVLAKSHALTNLELLRIHNVGWTEAGARAMATSETLPREFTESFRAEGDEDEGEDESED